MRLKCEKLKVHIAYVEVVHGMLVDEPKEEICRATRNSQDECCLEVDDTQKQVEEEFDMEDRDEFCEGREKFIQVREVVEVMKKKAKDSEENLESEAKSEREDETK